MGSIKNVISEPIHGHEEYHIMVSSSGLARSFQGQLRREGTWAKGDNSKHFCPDKRHPQNQLHCTQLIISLFICIELKIKASRD